MASLREMKKSLKNVRTTGQLAGAMRTVATAKYSRVNVARAASAPYALSCREALGITETDETATAGDNLCIVVLAGERGLCGGFNSEVLSYFQKFYDLCGKKATVITVGKMADGYCHSKKIDSFAYFPGVLPDALSAESIATQLFGLCREGKAERIVFIYQKFTNMLTQTPCSVSVTAKMLSEWSIGETETLFLPDRETATNALLARCFSGAVFGILLENAAGAQAATLTAMRSAYDNSLEASAKLELQINRRRQGEITSGVIETSSDNRE